MGLFHSGMNYWQRKSLSDRIHKQGRYAPEPSSALPIPIIAQPASPTVLRKKSSKPESPAAPLRSHASFFRRATKIHWPEKEVLVKLLWEKPTTQIAAELGVSDTAIKKHCRQLGIAKPPRGYWAKQGKRSESGRK